MSRPKESVWDYPRPPDCIADGRRVRVEFAGQVIAESTRTFRVRETSHPPTFYIPRDDIRMEFLESAPGQSFCEWKGIASYWTIRVGEVVANRAGWSYAKPSPRFAAIHDHFSFYASRMDACFVGDEKVAAQDGDFYGGWITSEIVGPFKGGPGTLGW